MQFMQCNHATSETEIDGMTDRNMQGEIEMNEWAMNLYFGRSEGWKGKSSSTERRDDTPKK